MTYYVDAGELKEIVEDSDYKAAAIKAFKVLENQQVESLSSITIVSEKGFDSCSDDDWYFSTMELLEQSNQIHNYKPE